MAICLDAGHTYLLTGSQKVSFIKRENGELVYDGTTNEEMLDVLINRLNYLDGKFPCEENKQALANLKSGLAWLNERTKKRVAQGVETKDIAHVS